MLVDYRGVTVPQVTELRRQIRAAGAHLSRGQEHAGEARGRGHVVRGVASTQFDGTTAVVYTGSDPVAMAKALTTFVKATPTMTHQGGGRAGPRGGGRPRCSDLASLPGKPELYAKLLFVLQAPMQQLVTVLSAVPRDLVNVLAAAEQKRAKTQVRSRKPESEV